MIMLKFQNTYSSLPENFYQNVVPSSAISPKLIEFNSKLANELGYMKLDFLNNSLYKNVRDEKHLDSLLAMKPMWEMLEYEEFVEKLFHIGEHFDIVKAIKPTSVDDLAVVLALIRPAKRYLLNQPRDVIDREIWIKPEDGYYFKKAHSYSYAVAIVVQMNLMVEQAMLSS